MRKNVRVATNDTLYKFRRGRNFPSSTNAAHKRPPACEEMGMGMNKRPCHRIAIIQQMRASYNGNTLASQARAEGSIPFARSRISATYIFYSVRMVVSATTSKSALPAPSSRSRAPTIKNVDRHLAHFFRHFCSEKCPDQIWLLAPVVVSTDTRRIDPRSAVFTRTAKTAC